MRVPPGPKWPKFIQAIAYLTVAGPVMKAMTKRFGPAFTMHLPMTGPTVIAVSYTHLTLPTIYSV